jgi:hypothetical protein
MPHLQHRGERIRHPLLERFGHLAAVRLAASGQLELDDIAGFPIETDQNATALPVRTGIAAEARGTETVRFLVAAGSVGRPAKSHQLIGEADGPDRDLRLVHRAVGGVPQPELGDRHAGPGEAVEQLDGFIGGATGLADAQRI